MRICKYGFGLAIITVALTIVNTLDETIIPEEVLETLIYQFESAMIVHGEININKCVDKILESLNIHADKSGLNTTRLNDAHVEFKYKSKLKIRKGLMNLNDGYLHGLATLTRAGNCTLNFDGLNVILTMPLAFRTLLFRYKYNAKHLYFKRSGELDGTIRGTKFTIIISINSATVNAQLESLDLKKHGKISVKFHVPRLNLWMDKTLTTAVIPFLKPELYSSLYNWLLDFVDDLLARYNMVVCTILGNCV